jgi:hypothetical protein
LPKILVFKLTIAFNPEDFKALLEGIPDEENVLHANLFDETPGIDRTYFSLSEREAAGMDVQMKLLLHVAHEALEGAGYSGVEDGSAFDPSTFWRLCRYTNQWFVLSITLSFINHFFFRNLGHERFRFGHIPPSSYRTCFSLLPDFLAFWTSRPHHLLSILYAPVP